MFLQQRQQADGTHEEQVQYRFVVSEMDIKTVHPLLSILSLQSRSMQNISIYCILKTQFAQTKPMVPAQYGIVAAPPPSPPKNLPSFHFLPPHHPNPLTFSIAKMWWLKYCWSCSLAKLMQNCSKLLWTNISNPKMSRMPAKVESQESFRLRLGRLQGCHSDLGWGDYRGVIQT